MPNKRTYVRSCSGKIFTLCKQLLGTLYAQCRVGFGAKLKLEHFFAKCFKAENYIKDVRLLGRPEYNGSKCYFLTFVT